MKDYWAATMNTALSVSKLLPIGYPRRDPTLDALPGFQYPPPGYGEVAFYWWLGDPLTRERLLWQLDQLSDRGIMGLQINYAHGDQGGLTWGLTYPGEPPIFSPDWWDLFDWFVVEANRRDIAVSVSDYTLGIGQGLIVDEALAKYPELTGKVLRSQIHALAGGQSITLDMPGQWLGVAAYPMQDAALGAAVDLRSFIQANTLQWTAPATPAPWQIVISYTEKVIPSLDPMHPASGQAIIEHFFQRFADRHPNQAGRGLNFFFSDELEFGLTGPIWTDRFAEEFRRRKGYDLIPELAALWLDIGPRTPKIRLDYSDVRVALSEEGYFKPIYEWHQQRGMIFGCDHGGRGKQVNEFGDYFRTQRWNQAPGCDQPRLETDLIKNKVASSIAHLYERQRVWLEGFHSSGWGTSTADITAATLANFIQGQNLMTLHGLYYATHGGWWEWAPPCNHFRMPYWAHLPTYMQCVQRLSYLLSQGVHCADVAILYPVASVEAGLEGEQSVQVAFDLGRALYDEGIDFDFMDFESLERAQIVDQTLALAGEHFRVLVIPSMRAVRFSTLEKALAFHRAGGLVLLPGILPEASDRIGRDDPLVDAMVQEIAQSHHTTNSLTVFQVPKVIGSSFTPDFKIITSPAKETPTPLSFVHRRIGQREVYAVLGVPQGATCFFRTHGKVELWDPWEGTTRPLYETRHDETGTLVKMPLGENEAQLIVFEPGDQFAEVDVAGSLSVEEVSLDAANLGATTSQNDAISVTGTVCAGGHYTGVVRALGRSIPISGDVAPPPDPAPLNDFWEFSLEPTLDNRWGDFRWPPSNQLIGAEVRQFHYALDRDYGGEAAGWTAPNLDESGWSQVTSDVGPYFWKIGPFPDSANMTDLEAELARLTAVDPDQAVEWQGQQFVWQPYCFSWRTGVEGDPGHQGYHGLKEEIHDEFIVMGNYDETLTDTVRTPEEGGSRYYLWTTVLAASEGLAQICAGGLHPACAWINGQAVDRSALTVPVRAGANPVMLRYDQTGKGYFVLLEADVEQPTPAAEQLAMRWYGARGILPFDAWANASGIRGWYRFRAAPGLRAVTFVGLGNAHIWIDGQSYPLESQPHGAPDSTTYHMRLPHAIQHPAQVTICLDLSNGHYGGSALPDPVMLDCENGLLAPGDWSLVDGLACYSGGARYSHSVELDERQAASQIILDLGDVVSSAEVWINGQRVGTRVAPPWTFDLSGQAKEGTNRIEVRVFNTLANHYRTIPTRYRGSTVSGMLGPVILKFLSRVVLC